MILIDGTDVRWVARFEDGSITCTDDALGFTFDSKVQKFSGTTHHLRWNGVVMYSDQLVSCIVARKPYGPNMCKINDVPELHAWSREIQTLLHLILPAELARIVWGHLM